MNTEISKRAKELRKLARDAWKFGDKGGEARDEMSRRGLHIIAGVPLLLSVANTLEAFDSTLSEVHYHFGCDPDCEKVRHGAIESLMKATSPKNKSRIIFDSPETDFLYD